MTHQVQVVATVLLGIAVLHTFSVGRIRSYGGRFEPNSVAAKLFQLLGEIEIVFGFWAAVFVLMFAALEGPAGAIRYVDGVDFTEAVFVFVIMAISATRSILSLASAGIDFAARALSRVVPALDVQQSFFLVTLVLGPLLGSLITEPAAMTVCALTLEERFFRLHVSDRFKYKTLALLFVNISIGGVLTHFAAPPVVMVAKAWNWDSAFMFSHFGYKAVIAVVANAALTLYLLRRDFAKMTKAAANPKAVRRPPIWITATNLIFLFLVIYAGHHISVLLGVFLFFLGVMSLGDKEANPPQIREALLVGFFLGGLVVLGKPQSWWLTPLITSLSEFPLFLGATALTAVTDNAALTYLGAQVPNLSEGLKYALVAGAVTGGGLTVIANAPNPAGYGILKDRFGEGGIQPLRLFVAALVPTVIAAICFQLP